MAEFKAAMDVNPEFWYDELRDFTFESTFVRLSLAEVKELIGYSERHNCVLKPPGDIDHHGEWQSALLQNLERRVDVALSESFGSAMMKLASRSPKDAVYEGCHERTRRLVQRALDSLLWSERELLVAPDSLVGKQVAAFMSGANRALCVHSGREALTLLLSSLRIRADLTSFVRDDDAEQGIDLALREWVDIALEEEFRAFVSDGRLTAVSQYFHFLHFDELVRRRDQVRDDIVRFFDAEVAPRIPHLRNYVIDFAYRWRAAAGKRIYVIELNPLNDACGAALYSWRTDRALLLGTAGVTDAKPPLRVVRKPDAKIARRFLVPRWERFLEEDRQRRLQHFKKMRRLRIASLLVLLAIVVALSQLNF
jgi:D123